MAVLSSPAPHKLRKEQRGLVSGGGGSNTRLLVTVSVMGSSGPIRFLVNEDDLVSHVIKKALRRYARQGRLPALGSSPDGFLLYHTNSGSDALSGWETIGGGSRGGGEVLNFLLIKKQAEKVSTESRIGNRKIKRLNGAWKALVNRSLQHLFLINGGDHASPRLFSYSSQA